MSPGVGVCVQAPSVCRPHLLCPSRLPRAASGRCQASPQHAHSRLAQQPEGGCSSKPSGSEEHGRPKERLQGGLIGCRCGMLDLERATAGVPLCWALPATAPPIAAAATKCSCRPLMPERPTRHRHSPMSMRCCQPVSLAGTVPSNNAPLGCSALDVQVVGCRWQGMSKNAVQLLHVPVSHDET